MQYALEKARKKSEKSGKSGNCVEFPNYKNF